MTEEIIINEKSLQAVLKRYDELEQENKELKEWKDKVVKLFESACRCKYLNEETDICSYTNEKCININKCAYKYQELSDNYRSALEEIRVIADDTFIICDDDCGNAIKIKLIADKINEVLG
jgi:hypothetical protein